MAFPKIKQVRAFVVRGGGADYHDQGGGHWIDDHIATPMSRYPEYRQSRQSFGINVLGTLVVEIEAENGVTGFAVTTGGEPACYIVEKHLARFLEGRDPALWIHVIERKQLDGTWKREEISHKKFMELAPPGSELRFMNPNATQPPPPRP